MAAKFRNFAVLPILILASCDFNYFDWLYKTDQMRGGKGGVMGGGDMCSKGVLFKL